MLFLTSIVAIFFDIGIRTIGLVFKLTLTLAALLYQVVNFSLVGYNELGLTRS